MKKRYIVVLVLLLIVLLYGWYVFSEVEKNNSHIRITTLEEIGG